MSLTLCNNTLNYAVIKKICKKNKLNKNKNIKPNKKTNQILAWPQPAL